jgi:hypothetical protein
MSGNENGSKVALADAIAGLRTQIREAATRAATLPRQERFHITDVEIELTVVAEGTVKGGTEVGWWIFKASGEVAAKEAVTHKVKLKLDVGSVEVGSDLETN